MAQRQVPGGPFVNEVGTAQRQVPGGPFVNETVSTSSSAPVGLASETDAAQALAGVQIQAAGLSTETDAATALAAVQIATAGLALETDSAQALAAVQSAAAGLATEADSALALTSSISGAAGLAAETDSALALAGVQGQIALIGTGVSNSGGTGTSYTTGAYDTTGATLLVVAVAHVRTATSVAVTDSKGNTWTALTGYTHATANGIVRLYYSVPTSVGAGHTATLSAAGTLAGGLSFLAFTGTASADVLDGQTGTNDGASASTFKPGSLTPTGSRDLFVYAGTLSDGTGSVSSVDVGEVNATWAFASAVRYGLGLAHYVNPAATALDPTFTRTDSGRWSAGIAAFRNRFNAPIKAATETDSAQPLAGLQARAVASGTETDAALALNAVQLKVTGTAAETDSAQALTASVAGTTGLASETDAAQALTGAHLRAVGQAAETDAALALTASTSNSAGLATETDAAVALAATQIAAIGLAAETDAAQALSSAQATTVGLATETDAALTLTPQGGAGYASETDAALPLTGAQIVALGLATESDVALALVPTQIIVVGLATETDTAYGMSTPSVGAVGLALETDTALRLSLSSGGTGANPADVWNYVFSNGLTAEETLVAVWNGLACCTLNTKLLRNKQITDPVTGKMTVYDDDGTTILLQGDLFEDAAGTLPYRGQGAERRERLT